MKKINLILILLVSLVFASCSNLFEAGQPSAEIQSYLTVSGTLSAEIDDGAVPRSAFPANNINLTNYTTNFYYRKTAAAETRTLCGTSAGISTFELKLPSLGDYYLEAESYLTSDSTKKIALKTRESVKITLSDAASFLSNIKIGVYIVIDESSTAKGSVNLPVQIFDVSAVPQMEVYENGQRIGGLTFSDATQSSDERLLDWTSVDLTKGVHEYTFKFYSDASCTNLVYQFTEKVTILPGMETNTWINNGNAEYIGMAEGKKTICITQACLDNFALTNFYVSSGEDGDDSHNGSYFAPLKTIQKALDKCTDGSKEYTINLNGTFEPSTKLIVTKKVKIQKAEGASEAVIKRPASGGHTNNMVFISSGSVCTLKGITIDGSSISADAYGAGIRNNATLTLKNCVIKNCRTGDSYNGGAIYTDGTLTVDGGVIGDENASSPAGANNCSNYAKFGGAIYVYSGTFTLCGNAVIAYNYAKSSGGGVYIKSGSTFEMQGGSITGCTAATYGNGVCVDGTFNMSGSAYIASNNDVYLNSDKAINIADDLTSTTLPVAVVTLYSSDYNATHSVLTGTNVSVNYYKIDVTPPLSGYNAWYIGSLGKLNTFTNYDTGAKIIRNPANFDKDTDNGRSIYKVDSGKTVYIVENLELDRELRVNGTVKVTSNNGKTIKFTQNTPRITAQNGCTIGETDGRTLTIDGNSTDVAYPLVSVTRGSTVYLRNVTLQNNYSTTNGGAMVVNGSAEVHLTKCTITGCKSDGNGGAICFPDCSYNLYLNQTTISNNSATGKGGAIYTYYAANPSNIYFDFEDSVSTASKIINNTSTGEGGGIYFWCGIIYYHSGHKVAMTGNKQGTNDSQIYNKQQVGYYATTNISSPGTYTSLATGNITTW